MSKYYQHQKEKTNKRCIDCGNLISPIPNTIRCCKCANKIKGEKRRKPPEEIKEHQKHRNQKWYNKQKKACPQCGNPISPKSQTCQSCMGKRFSQEYKMEAHANWKGGRFTTKSGYTQLRIPNHPRAKRGYIPEHLVIWEKTIGKQLPIGWHIHHLNGIKNDNRFANLMAVPSKKHSLIIPLMQRRIQELEGLLKHQMHLESSVCS